MNEAVIGNLLRGESIVLVGPSDAGKSHWVQNFLIPKIQEVGKSVQYSKDGFTPIEISDIAIFDEAEILFDATRLQEKYPDDRPYYSEKYLQQVADWHALYSSHREPSVYIISRKESDVQYLVDNFHTADWDNRELRVFRFS